LGPTDRLQQAVTLWRISHLLHELKPEETSLAKTFAIRWEKSYRDAIPADKLREWVWQPLAPYLESCKTVLISPDGALAAFPLSALPGKTAGGYLLEELTIAVVPVPQMLPEILSRQPASESTTPALLMIGNINLTGDPGSPTDPTKASQRSADPFLGLGKIPGSMEQIKSIHDIFTKSMPQGKAIELTGDQPTEQAFRDAAPYANFIHLDAHGYADVSDFQHQPSISDPEVAQKQPDLLCGVALVGALRPAKANRDDGLLTGLEVKSLDLENVDLVTIAACQSGLGLEASGEGMFGLQRAFQEAGARSTITTLWSIPSGPTNTLMVDFYDNLWTKKMPRAEALRQAQLKMLREGAKDFAKLSGRPEDAGKRLPPFFWGAFVLSGDWR
jgi:CHAT domain-containing protein